MRVEPGGWRTSARTFVSPLGCSERPLVHAASSDRIALGIGMNGTMFTIVNAMIRGLPIDGPERILSIHARDGAGRWRGFGVSYLDFRISGRRQHILWSCGVQPIPRSRSSEDGRASERASAAYVSANAFQLLGEKPSIGRDFVPADDDRPGAPAVVMLGGRMWRGSTTRIPHRGAQHTSQRQALPPVIGVMPDGFRFPVLAMSGSRWRGLTGLANQTRDTRTLQLFGRLAEGNMRLRRKQNLVDCCSPVARIPSHQPEHGGGRRLISRAISLPMSILIALMIAVGFVWLVACINVANLLLARSLGRSRELSIASRLERPAGGLSGNYWSRVDCSRWLPARWVSASPFGAVALFEAVAGITFPYYIQWTVDGRVALFVAAGCLGAAFIAGLLPAVQASKLAANCSLESGGKNVAKWQRKGPHDDGAPDHRGGINTGFARGRWTDDAQLCCGLSRRFNR